MTRIATVTFAASMGLKSIATLDLSKENIVPEIRNIMDYLGLTNSIIGISCDEEGHVDRFDTNDFRAELEDSSIKIFLEKYAKRRLMQGDDSPDFQVDLCDPSSLPRLKEFLANIMERRDDNE